MTVTVPLHKALERTIEVVARNWGVKPAAIKAAAPHRGDRWVCEARDVVCLLARRHLPLTQGQVGQYLGGRTPSTINNAAHRAAETIQDKPGYGIYFRRVEKELKKTINR